MCVMNVGDGRDASSTCDVHVLLYVQQQGCEYAMRACESCTAILREHTSFELQGF